MRIPRPRLKWIVALLALSIRLLAQPAPELKAILDRLDRLEAENRDLRDQIRELRESAPPRQEQHLDEKIAIVENRVAELAETKVEASQRFPVRLTGMALVNAFYNSKRNGGSDNPAIASLTPGGAVGGATWRQTILGLDYRGGQTLWNGKVRGSLFMDFFGGNNQPLGTLLRIRTASFGVDWNTRSLTIAQDKALVSFREPDSLSQVGIAPLTGAGNLWLWLPQVRFEQRLRLDDRTGFNVQAAAVQTSETSSNVPAAFAPSLERFRPGFEGRIEFFRKFGGESRFEIAPGFHTSTTHVAAGSAPSNVFFLDWMARPVHSVELTGFFFNGENVAHFGTGGIRQGFWIPAARDIRSVHSRGGWAQLSLIATPRLTFHLLAGQHDDRDADVRAGFASSTGGGIGKNQSYGINFFYKLAPNVIASFETMQVRTKYLSFGNRLNNHYDLALAYLF